MCGSAAKTNLLPKYTLRSLGLGIECTDTKVPEAFRDALNENLVGDVPSRVFPRGLRTRHLFLGRCQAWCSLLKRKMN